MESTLLVCVAIKLVQFTSATSIETRVFNSSNVSKGQLEISSKIVYYKAVQYDKVELIIENGFIKFWVFFFISSLLIRFWQVKSLQQNDTFFCVPVCHIFGIMPWKLLRKRFIIISLRKFVSFDLNFKKTS